MKPFYDAMLQVLKGFCKRLLQVLKGFSSRLLQVLKVFALFVEKNAAHKTVLQMPYQKKFTFFENFSNLCRNLAQVAVLFAEK
ncbi:MAG: hypothetical protein J6T98_08950 [Salinivirgaceae bacterium]|nr:hypothetical protein [Salinivirgaceae bacterium]